jgi:AAA+ ATPase superfamily predicted ATPase
MNYNKLMKRNELHYRKDVAFINRESELVLLKGYLDERPESILFIHGPKSSGKTTLLYKFFEQVGKEQKLDVKFLNLREIHAEFSEDFKYKDFTLIEEDIEKTWDTVGGSMWEIQDILTELFNNPIDQVLNLYKRKIKAIIEYYIGADMQKEKVLRIFLKKETARIRDFINEGITPDKVEQLLQDTVRNNILYFDPTEALYYPQGKSYQWGIKLYFESIDSSAWM